MSLRVERREGQQARKILIGMIANRRVCGAVAARWDGKLFDSRWANLIAGWCVEHYKKYRKPPSREIATIFDAWAIKAKDKNTIELVEGFLSSLSGQWTSMRKGVREEYTIDLAGQYFTRVKLASLRDEIEAGLENGEMSALPGKVKSFSEVNVGMGREMVKVLQDREALISAFEYEADVVIKYPGALGTFFGDALCRDGFISIEGPEKRGKTWILLDMAWMGMLQGRRVAFFEVGDLSRNQIMRRFMVRASRRPLKAGTVQRPTMISPSSEEQGAPIVDYKELTYKKPLSANLAWKKCRKIVKRRGDDLLRLSVHANSSISVAGINDVLEGWRRWDGWEPDIVVVDYFDILAPLNGKFENSRESVSATWKAGRRLSQEWHVLLLTASQTDADSYDTDVITMSNFSQTKTKRAETTGTAGLNQTDKEKEKGIYRFNWVAGREWEYSTSKCVYCAGSLAIAAPLMYSTFTAEPQGFRGKHGTNRRRTNEI